MDLNPISVHRTLGEHVFQDLRRAILDGSILPGQILRYDELSVGLRVSTMPVREALRRLESEGLVRRLPHRSAVVTELSLEDLEEIYAIRFGLEGLAARLAASQITPEVLAQMRPLLRRLEALSAHGELDTYLDLERQYHQICYTATRRPRLGHLVDSYRERAGRYIRVGISGPVGLEKSLGTQRRLLEACEARDGALAERLIQEALRWTLMLVKPLLEDRPPGSQSGESAAGSRRRRTAGSRGAAPQPISP